MSDVLNIDQNVGLELISTNKLTGSELMVFCQRANKDDQPYFYAAAFTTDKFSTKEMEKICLAIESSHKDDPESIALVYGAAFKTGKISIKKIMKVCHRINSQELCQTVIASKKLPYACLIIVAKMSESHDCNEDEMDKLWDAIMAQIAWDKLKRGELLSIGFHANNEKMWRQVTKAIAGLKT